MICSTTSGSRPISSVSDLLIASFTSFYDSSMISTSLLYYFDGSLLPLYFYSPGDDFDF
jgi:hypothetical protein